MVYRMFDCKKEMLTKLLENGVVITATDTNVGKTLFSIHCLLSTHGTYWKPIQSGQPSDREQVLQATGLDDSHFIKEKYNLTQPLSPHEAAAYDKQIISFQRFRHMPKILHPPLIIEGSGGVLVPLNKRYLMVDLFCHFGLPVIIVARSTLGTINHTLMTLECLRSRGLHVLGVVLVGPALPGNEKAISFYGKVNILGRSK
jgi:dethiobiotin synthetase